ncbi:MAG: beta-galactosidase, partial [Firmicutes bacterium]|nr:beta-galactosidase [Bacillota bacterium]
NITLAVSDVELWEPGDGRLYDLKYELKRGGCVLDEAKGYFGIRTVSLTDGAILINGRKVFQRLVLDQGFYPDGIYTAPTDEALVNDIKLSMEAGFNGARLHQKVFEQRFLYHADRLGYLVWGEFASWGLDVSDIASLATFVPQWLEEIERDFSHPAIVGWCPLNETWDYDGRRQDDRFVGTLYKITKAADDTRPCIDTSGNYHVETDVYDIHDYEQSVDVFAARFGGDTPYETFPKRQRYEGQPYFVSEYGGTRWAPGKEGWGYGGQSDTEDEAVDRICGLTQTLLDCRYCCAFCYTQLTDVEQEQNGIYTYERGRKFTDENYARIKRAMQKTAAIEE